jgi:Phosphoesterase family
MARIFEHVVIVMLENASRKLVLQNAYMKSLLKKGVFLSNAIGVTHPSQPNYILSVAGDTFGINGDDSFWVAPYITSTEPNSQPPVTSIVDLLEAKGLTWKSYAENLQPSDIAQPPVVMFPPPKPPYPPTGPSPAPDSDPLFARRHVPCLNFPNIVSNPVRAANIVNARDIDSDLASGKLPNYSWYSPNLINDGHSTIVDGKVTAAMPSSQTIDNIADFLNSFLGDNPLAKFPPRTLIVVTFDESFPYSEYDIYTLLTGDMLEAGTSRSEPYNHYSLLRSIELNFEISSLERNDASAEPYWFVDGGSR